MGSRTLPTSSRGFLSKSARIDLRGRVLCGFLRTALVEQAFKPARSIIRAHEAGSRFRVQGSRFAVPGSRFKGLGSAAAPIPDARASGAADLAAMTPVALPPKHFTHGTILRWRRVPGLVLAEVEYEPGRRVPRHTHVHARLVLVLSGSVTEVRFRGAGASGGDDNDTAAHGPSTLLFRCAEEPHAYVIGPSGATCLVVDIDPAWLGRVREQAPVLAASAAFRGGLVVHLAHR